MNKKIIRFIALFAIIFFSFVGLSSCGNKDNSKTLYETDASAVQSKINENKINDLITGLNDLIKLDDPVNKILWQKELDEDLILKKISTPITLDQAQIFQK